MFAGRRGKIVIAVCAAVIIVAAAGFAAAQPGKGAGFSTISGLSVEKIDRIDVRTDWGRQKTITSKSDIAAVLKYLDGYGYHQRSPRVAYTGYLYQLLFYSGGRRVIFVLGMYPEINDRQYSVGKQMDTGSIEKIVGLYPPK